MLALTRTEPSPGFGLSEAEIWNMRAGAWRSEVSGALNF